MKQRNNTPAECRGRIYWKSTITGAIGHGTAILNFIITKAFIDEGNQKFPELHHWFIPIMQTQEMNR